jgi:hypothetical protein
LLLILKRFAGDSAEFVDMAGVGVGGALMDWWKHTCMICRVDKVERIKWIMMDVEEALLRWSIK